MTAMQRLITSRGGRERARVRRHLEELGDLRELARPRLESALEVLELRFVEHARLKPRDLDGFVYLRAVSNTSHMSDLN